MWKDRSKERIRQKGSAKQVPYARDANNDTEAQWYRCRHCGFVCSDQRDEHDTHGDGCSSETVYIADLRYVITVDGVPVTVDGEYVMMELENTPMFSFDQFSATKATVNSGCPLCGSHSWKG